MSGVKNTLRLVYYSVLLYTSVVSYGHLYSVRMRPNELCVIWNHRLILIRFFFHSTQRERERERKREKGRERERKREKEKERERKRKRERKEEKKRKKNEEKIKKRMF